MSDSPAALSLEQATDLTRKIRQNVKDLAGLMRKAWEGKVWVPLGYDSFADWLDGEFDYSHTRGYQLINIATVTEDLTKKITLPDGFSLTDLQTRQIIHFGVAEVLTMLSSRATKDPGKNANLIKTVLRELKTTEDAATPVDTEPPVKLPVRTIQQPRAIQGGQFNARTAVSSMGSLLNQAQSLPSPKDLPLETVKLLHDDLHAALTLARARLTEFDNAIDGEAQSA